MSGEDGTRDAPATPGAPKQADDEAATAAGRRAITRRHFVGLLAAGAGATFAVPALAQTRPRRRSERSAAAEPPSPRVAKGLAEQRESLDRTLRILRDFELPPGSEQGFAFRPLPVRRKP